MDFQDIIHRFELGGARYVRLALIPLVLLIGLVLYDSGAFKNMSTQEAMDSAQLARNIAQGKGYTTLFIRPFSLYLVRRHYLDTQGIPPLGANADPALIKTNHPDIANAPAYPLLLAGVMKVMPFNYPIPTKPRPFWSLVGQFWRYQPDFLISLFNQVLLLVVVVLVYLLARRLFDPAVAWLSALVVLGTELLWRFTVSGLSTTLLLLILMGLIWCLVLLEKEMREPARGPIILYILSAVTGFLVGLGGLTRYSFGWMILPVLAFLLIFSGRQRLLLALAAFVAFAAVMTPWVVRNYEVSGTPFGTAGYAPIEATSAFPEYRLQRSIEPDFSGVQAQVLIRKLVTNLRHLVQDDLLRLGGSWVSTFFLVGLLVNVPNPAARRLRYFLLMSLAVLIVVQALGRTQLSEESADINSENLLVLLVPLVLVYGVSLFYQLLGQIEFSFRELRVVVIALFAVLASLSMILTLLPLALDMVLHFQLPNGQPRAYPPYHPPAIQTVSDWVKPDELIMSDIPWAVAWYGQRQSVWLTLNASTDYFAINDYLKPVPELYLTRVTLDDRFLPQLMKADELTWPKVILEAIFSKEGPTKFPLHKVAPGWLPEQFVLTDRDRWHKAP